MALISFDLDGVLQRNPFHYNRPNGVFGHIKRELAPHMGLADPETAAAAALDMVRQEHLDRLDAGKLVEAYDWDGIVGVVAGHLGYPGKLDVSALVTHYCDQPDMVWLYPGATECLESLAAGGHTLVSITNGFRSYQEPVLRKLQVLPFFQLLITPELVGAAKPQPAIFKAAEPFGSPRVHVGDTLVPDVGGSKAAGWFSIYIVQMGAPGATALPDDLASLAPWERPARAAEWLAFRYEREARWHRDPHVSQQDCVPDAIVQALDEVPGTVTALLAQE